MNDEADPAEPGFNTQAVERLTGVPADTFRAWERRYGVPSPRRLPGGRRLYSAADVDTVRWLRRQTEAGVAISLAVRQAQQDPRLTQSGPTSVPALLAPAALWRAIVEAALRYDGVAVEQSLSQALAAHPLDVVCLDVVVPALVDLGERWHRGEITPAVEHFATQVLRRRLDQLSALLDAGTEHPLVVVGTAPGELHDIGALVFSILLRRRGINVIYLGASVSAEAAVDVVQQLKPELLCLSAAQEDTARALLPLARALNSLNGEAVRMAFGGRAFDLDPSLADALHGEYLGENTRQAVSRVEAIVRGTAPLRNAPPATDHAPAE